jgi:hypothetical protein
MSAALMTFARVVRAAACGVARTVDAAGISCRTDGAKAFGE